MTGTAAELLQALDDAGHERALVFAMHEPGGYGAANDETLAAARASGGRLQALVRVDPNAPGAVGEARRCLDAGARGIKLHPRSDAFGLPHPVVSELVALAGELRAPVLFHAGRGIPNLGAAAADLAARHPGARIILAHAGISDLGWIPPAARALPNLFFDTAWWQVYDLLALFAHVPPGRILYASDLPYGTGVFAATAMLRCALAVGLDDAAIAAVAGGQLERIVAGEEPLELGPAPGAPHAERCLGADRAVAYLTAAGQQIFREQDPGEALALARLSCQAPAGSDDAVLAAVDGLTAAAQRAQQAAGGGERWPGIEAVMAGQILAGTHAVGV
jgi:hypothetical protein